MKTYENYIGGDWVASVSGQTLTSQDPATGEDVATVQRSVSRDVEHAVEAAARAFAVTAWAHDAELRSNVLLEWAGRIERAVEPLARLLVLENGKILGEARYEIWSVVSVLRYNAGLARNIFGRSLPLSRDVFAILTYEPIGVVGIIVPWNWPISLLLRDLAPALAAGNAVVVKPASHTSGITCEVIRLLAECAALPNGVVNLVTGPGDTVGEALVTHARVGMIAFTGDSETGKRVMQLAAPTMKKLSLELGGKAANVFCADADLEKAIPAALAAIFTTTSGQVCTAASRLIVERSIKDEVVRRLREGAERLRIGSGLDESTQLGPVVSRAQMEKILRYIELGKSTAALVCGGDRVLSGACAKGYFVAPTIFDDVPADSPLVQEEIFGPVLVIQSFESDAEAIELANGTVYGLASGLWTENVHRAMRLARAIRAGTVWVNTYHRFYPETEVGGYGQSGNGRMAGVSGPLEFSELKHINLDSSVG